MRDRSTDYDARRERTAKRDREESASGRDIGPIPKVKRVGVRRKAVASLRVFLEQYFPNTFVLGWSDDHLKLIERLEICITKGGLFCLALPRGSGKTSIAIRAALWAVLTGRRRFVLLIGATEPHAAKLLQAMRLELQFNDLLAGDFPEVCFPIRKLENITKRQAGQTCQGKPTMIRLADHELILPSLPRSKSAGAIVRTAGLTGAIRGQIATTADGRTIRPDLVIPDDPQTRESAKSPTQNQEREDLINGDVLGLAGPGQSIAAVMPCTVIYPGDLSERFLDREKNPTWQGQRGKLVYAFPTNMAMWDEYAEVRRESFREHGDGRDGNAFYLARRERMDAGARVGWEHRKEPGDVSALQYAMNLKIDKPRAFNAEFQNEPDQISDSVSEAIDAGEMANKLSRVGRGIVPRECTRVTTFVDVGKSVLWYAVAAWDEQFGGAIIDYGAWPKQNRSYFAAADARPTIQDEFPGVADEAAVYKALASLVDVLATREYVQAETSAVYRASRVLIDSGWLSDSVYQFCRRSQHSNILLPSKGYAVNAAARTVGEWARKPGERSGRDWRLSPASGPSGRLLTFDPNAWKSFVLDRLKTPFAARGCLSLFGADSGAHTMFADHCTSEYFVASVTRGATRTTWAKRPDRIDNHWWDCLVGCAVAASEQGLRWTADEAATASHNQPSGNHKKPSELQRERMQARGLA
jgi:hypothetical protein